MRRKQRRRRRRGGGGEGSQMQEEEGGSPPTTEKLPALASAVTASAVDATENPILAVRWPLRTFLVTASLFARRATRCSPVILMRRCYLAKSGIHVLIGHLGKKGLDENYTLLCRMNKGLC